MDKNFCIKCDVTRCRHNADGCNCRLDAVKITCGNEACTRCDDYSERD